MHRFKAAKPRRRIHLRPFPMLVWVISVSCVGYDCTLRARFTGRSRAEVVQSYVLAARSHAGRR